MLLNSPVEVFWCVTNRCNLNCNFCLTRSTKTDNSDLSVEQRNFILHEIFENNVLKVYLTGGEPMLCPELFDYIRQLKEHNIFIELTTNGTLLDVNAIKKLKDYDINRVQLSLNGSNAYINDRLMGRSFARIVKNIGLLISNQVPTQVKVTVTRENLQNILELIRFLVSIGVTNIDLSEVHPLGRAFDNWNRIAPNIKDLAKLQNEIEQTPEYLQFDISFHSPSLLLEKNQVPSTCSMGAENTYSCLILANGDVIPCAFAMVWQIPNNICPNGLLQSWRGLTKFKQYVNPSRLTGKCATCDLKNRCKGGCRAMVYLFTNNLWAENPFCNYNSNEEIFNEYKRMENTDSHAAVLPG